MNLTNLELNHDNSTGLRISFRYKGGFVPKDEQIAVCSSNGMWFPDLTQFECSKTLTATLQYTTILLYRTTLPSNFIECKFILECLYSSTCYSTCHIIYFFN